MAFDKGDLLGPLGGIGQLIDYVISGGKPAGGRDNIVKQVGDAAVLNAANLGVATDNALTSLDRGIERTKTGVANLFRETPAEPALRPYRDYYAFSDIDQNRVSPWDVISGTATVAPFMKPAGNLIQSGARAIEGSVKPILFDDAVTQAAKDRVASTMQCASKQGLFAEVPFRPPMTNAEFAEAAYYGQPADAFNPAAWTGRPTMAVPVEDYVGQNVARLEAEAARRSTAPQAHILAKDLRTVANPTYVTVDPLPTPNVNYFTSEALRDAALKQGVYDPLKTGTLLTSGSKIAEGIDAALDPTNPANIAAREEAQLAEEVANRINSSQTAQSNTESAGGAQPSSQPDLSFSYPSPLLPADPTQMTLFNEKIERPKEFNTVAKMDNATLRDWYLKQTGGALDLGPVFEALRNLPDYFSAHEAAKIALTEATNKAGIEASDSWLSTIGWLITIPFAIRRGMSPDELWEKIVNSRIALNPQVRQAQAALENIEALRNARLDLLSKVSPLIAYAIQGTSNPELAEARVLNALAHAKLAEEQTALTKEQTRKTQQGNELRENVLGEGNSRWVNQSATKRLQAKSNK